MERPQKTPSPARSLVRSILKSAIPTYLLDPSSRVAFANQALATLLQVSIEDLIGLDCRTSLPADAARLRLIASQLSAPKPLDGAWLQVQAWEAHPNIDDKSGKPASHGSIRLMIDLGGADVGFRLGLLFEKTQAATMASWLQTETHLDVNRLLHQSLVQLRARYDRLDGMVCLAGTSILARKALRQAQAAIETAHPVCLVGPEGVGKTDTAKAIYMARMKRKGIHDLQFRLYPVECRLMDTSLLASIFEMLETPQAAHMPRSQQALYLNRLDLLPLEVVPMLLTFLSQRSCEVLASFATAPNHSQHAGNEAWEELLATIDVHRVELASLVDRPADIPLLVELILQGAGTVGDAARRGQRPRRIEQGALASLQAYGYPRNVQELRTILDHAVAECARSGEQIIETKHLPIAVQTYSSFVETRQACTVSLDLDRLLEDVERTAIERMLERYPTNRTLVAKHLGISRARLLRRIEQWGLGPEHDPGDANPEKNTPFEATSASKEATISPEEQPVEQGHRRRPGSKRGNRPQAKTGTSDSSPKVAPESLPHTEEPIEFTEIDFRESDGEPA